MPFKVQDLAIALYESSGNIQIGGRSCGGTQLLCTFMPVDHLVSDPDNLDVLVAALRQTLDEAEARVRSREERRAAGLAALKAEGGSDS